MSRKPDIKTLTPIFESVTEALALMHRVEQGEEIGQDSFSDALSTLATFVAVATRCLPHVSSDRISRATQAVMVEAATRPGVGG